MARRRSAPAAGVAAALLASAAVPSRGFVRELYTTNAVCMQKYCVNPVFPALEQLPAMESKRWAKHTLANVSQFMSFCGQVVDYDLAAPMAQSLNATGLSARARAERVQEEFAKGNVVLDYEATGLSDPVKDAIVQMDRAAARSYFLHLGGMGIEVLFEVAPGFHGCHQHQRYLRVKGRGDSIADMVGPCRHTRLGTTRTPCRSPPTHCGLAPSLWPRWHATPTSRRHTRCCRTGRRLRTDAHAAAAARATCRLAECSAATRACLASGAALPTTRRWPRRRGR